MPVPDLSNLRALVAHDQAGVRKLVAEKLRELGVTRIDELPADAAGSRLIALMTEGLMAGGPEPRSPEQLADLVARFTHDVANPLTSAILLSRVLAAEAASGSQAASDAQRVYAAVEEIAGLVRDLTQRLVVATRARRTEPS